jgi:hypothetical protein
MTDQLSAYRELQKKKHQQVTHKQQIFDKYKNFLEFDLKKRSAFRIQNYAKRYFFKKTRNTLSDVPGLYRFRIKVTEFNLCSHDIQRSIIVDIEQNNRNKKQKLITDLDLDMTDDEIRNIVLENIDLNEQNTLSDSCDLLRHDLYYVLIDLRIYGPFPDAPLYLPDDDQTIYFTEEQQNKIRSVWQNINPETNNGLRFQQMLDSSKALVELYNQETNQELKETKNDNQTVNQPDILKGLHFPNPELFDTKNKQNPPSSESEKKRFMTFRDIKK